MAKVGAFEQALIAFFNREFADLMAKISVKGDFNDEIDAGLKAGIEVQGHAELVSRSGSRKAPAC